MERISSVGFSTIFLAIICIGIVLIIAFPPFQALFSSSAVFSIGLLALWIFITFMRNPEFYLKLDVKTIVFVFLTYIFIITYFGGNPVLGNRYLGLASLYLIKTIYDYNRKYIPLLNRFLVKIIFVITLITLSITTYSLLVNPFISRSIKSSGEYTRQLSSNGIGGYSFIYSMVILFPIVFFLAINGKRGKNRFLLLIFSGMIVFLIVLSNYFTAFFCMIISLVTILFFGRTDNKNKYAKFYILVMLSLLIGLFHKSILSWILEGMIHVLPDSLTQLRLKELQSTLNQFNQIKIATPRWDLMMVSIKTFLDNPVFGLSLSRNRDLFDATISSGQHSFLIDSFAYLGILLGLIQIIILYKPLMIQFKCKKSRTLVAVVLINFSIIAILNNLTNSIGLFIYFILPFFIDKIELEKSGRKGII